MIRAELTDGRIVELPKDCGCLDEIHTGPHWLHMDEVNYRLNRRSLDSGSWLGAHAFARQEIMRLNEKERNMVSRNIARIIRDGEPQP